MNREEAKELLPIMQAFADGKAIQFRTNNRPWVDLLDNDLNINAIFEYRIKPEPKYRPFKSQEECWIEMHNHSDFGWVKIKHNGNYSDISTMYKSCAEERITVANSSYTLAQAFEIFTFTDSTPFGIREE